MSRQIVRSVASTITVGLDLGDRFSRYSETDFETGVIAEGRLRTTPEALQRQFAGRESLRIVMESAPTPPGSADSSNTSAMRSWWPTPARRRQSPRRRLPSTSTPAFARKVEPHIPETLRPALRPLLEMIDSLSQQIRAADRQLEALARERYPETERLRQVAGVGAITALCYILTLEEPARFKNGRSVGAYLGLRPRQRDSGAQSPQLRITKRGDVMLRRLLVGSAQYILGPFGPDCDLRRWGLRLAQTWR